MAVYVDRADLTASQRKGLKWLAGHPDAVGEEYATGELYAIAVLQRRGDAGFARREAMRKARLAEVFDAATAATTKSTITTQVDAEFAGGE